MVFKKQKKVLIGLGTVGLTAGITSAVVGRAGTLTGTNVAPIQTGIATATSFTGIAATAYSGSAVLSSVKKLQPKKRNKKRK